VPDTSPPRIELSEPSEQIASLLSAVAAKPGASDGIRAMMQRESQFTNRLAAHQTGIALYPYARQFAEEFLDAYWSDEPRQQAALRATGTGTDREVIIGSGFHAAVYAAVRELTGFP
jgi:hypothetical protein